MAEEAYGIHCRIFDGVDREAFRKHVVEPDAVTARLRIYRDADGSPIGYGSLSYSVVPFEGTRFAVIRGAGGVLQAHRHKTLFGPYMARQLIRMYLANVGRPTLVFTCPVSPAMFAAIHRTLVDFTPHHGKPASSSEQRLMRALSDHFGLTGDGPCRQMGWRVRGESLRNYAGTTDPAIRYYLEHNPRFAEGFGLMTLCPMNLANVRSGLARVARTRTRALRRRHASTRTTS